MTAEFVRKSDHVWSQRTLLFAPFRCADRNHQPLAVGGNPRSRLFRL